MSFDKKIAEMIDHTFLKADGTEKEIEKLCHEAIEYQFKSVCVHPSFVAYASSLLEDKGPIPISVVGFPLGATLSSVKAFEAKEAVAAGAREIDMVISIGAIKQKKYEVVFEDISSVVNEISPCPVKVILETCYLTDDEKLIVASLAKVAGAAFLKTSSGFGTGGATVEDVRLLRNAVGDEMGVKASGGIKTHADAVKMIAAGATRLGCSNSVEIVKKS